MRNRDMYYQNVNQGFQGNPQYIPPSGYNMNTNYQAYGPNLNNGGFNPNMNNYQSFEDYTDERLNKIEKQIRNLDSRLQKIESTSAENITDNIYMI